jgi:tetraacyldisaccharide 4'-kinase
VDVAVDDAARRFGDEPVLIARRMGVQVWVGADRFVAGAQAETGSGVARNVHLLDDGFQHRKLARGMDVVVVTAEDLKDALLPAGNRREGLGALRRADAVVVREEERAEVELRLRGDAVVWRVRREMRFPEPLGVLSAGLRPLAFCAIARPEGFALMLANAGCGVVETVAFGDHHGYAMDDVERIVMVARGCGATGFWTTEKDAVKLSEAMLERLRSIGPVGVVALEVKFMDEADVVRVIEGIIS